MKKLLPQIAGNKRFFLMVVLIISVLIVPLGDWVFTRFIIGATHMRLNDYSYIFFGVSILLTSIVMYEYLSGSKDRSGSNGRNTNPLSKKIDVPKSNGLKDINESIQNILNSRITDEFIKNKVEEIYSPSIIQESKMFRIFLDFISVEKRIEFEISRLRRSANLNLVIGTITTIVAITALTYEVFFYEIRFTETVELLSHYIPRISIVIFIEIFAFFFLKLYKSNLSDIKYFSNEKTNVEMKFIALKIALAKDNEKLLNQAVGELSSTERNFKLKNDETTSVLEKEQYFQENKKIVADFIRLLSKPS